MSARKPSKYQQDIFKAYNTTNSNIFISAGPGSGKSWTLLELVNQTPIGKKIWMSAFNKSIADELKSKVRSSVEVSTLHSKGMSLLRANLNCKFKVNAIKSWVFGKQHFSAYLEKRYKKNEKDKSIHLFTLSRLVDLYRMNLEAPTIDNLTMLSEAFSVDADRVEIEQAVELIEYLDRYNSSRPDELIIDFTDMLWLTYKFVDKDEYPKYDVVMIDEIQDVNRLQKKLIDNSIKRNGRFIAVGDENQAIYQFMGSNLDSMNEFKRTPNTVLLPLSVSYRCAKNIVDEANKVFPGLESYEENPEGVVRYGTLDEIRPGDFVICRNNLPLAERYIDLLGEEKKSYILGKDFGKSLSSIASKIDDIKDLDVILEEKREELRKRGVQNIDGNAAMRSLMEKCQILRVLFNRYSSLDKVKSVLEGMFAEDDQIDKENSIILSTGHRAKGLESRRVFWINPELIPSKYARTEAEIHQELCLKYVIITRAKEELVIVTGSELDKMSDNVCNFDCKEVKSTQ